MKLNETVTGRFIRHNDLKISSCFNATCTYHFYDTVQAIASTTIFLNPGVFMKQHYIFFIFPSLFQYHIFMATALPGDISLLYHKIEAIS